jgi:hypothetical protein
MVANRQPTLIQALHRRYEECVAVSNAADLAQPRQADDPSRWAAIERVTDASMAEIDAIRAVLMRQIPVNDADLSILMLHAYMLVEFMTGQAHPDKGDVEILFCGIRWAFDYLMSEDRIDGATAGTNMIAIGEMVRVTRRAMSGDFVEEVAP